MPLFLYSPLAHPPRRGGYATSEELLFVAPTQIENDGATISLCHLVKTNAVIIGNFWRSLEGYALAENGYMADSYYVLTDTQFEQFQSAGLITADIPQTPKLSVAQGDVVSGLLSKVVGQPQPA